METRGPCMLCPNLEDAKRYQSHSSTLSLSRSSIKLNKNKKKTRFYVIVAVFFFFHGLVCKWIYFYVFPRQLERFNIVIVSLQVGRLSWGHGDNIQIQLVLLSALLLHSCQKQKLAFSSGQEVMATILFHIFLAVFWVHFAQATGSLLSPKGVNYEGMTFKLYIQNDLALHNHVIC